MDATLGIAVPDFLLSAVLEDLERVEPAMRAARYSDSKITRVQCMAAALIAAAGSPRRIQSQGAPSGASRSFKNDDQALTALRTSLAALDTAGTVAALVGPDPNAQTLLMVV